MYKGDQQRSYDLRNKLVKLTVVGGLVFWAANFATSLTSLAEEYRAALSISYFPMIIESLLGGMIISCCISCILLYCYDKVPTKGQISKSMILSLVTLPIASIMTYISASGTSDMYSILLVGAVLNIPRFLALGLALGYSLKKEDGVKTSV